MKLSNAADLLKTTNRGVSIRASERSDRDRTRRILVKPAGFERAASPSPAELEGSRAPWGVLRLLSVKIKYKTDEFESEFLKGTIEIQHEEYT